MYLRLAHRGHVGHAVRLPQDRFFYGRVIRLGELVTFRGRTMAEARQAFEAAVDRYLARGRRPGRSG